MRLTKIICTLGPATSSKSVQKKLVQSGMDVARLNLSHGCFADHKANFKQIRAISRELNKKVAVLFDLPGPKLRLKFPEKPVILKENDLIEISTGASLSKAVAVNYKGLPSDLEPGNHILINEGQVRLKVAAINRDSIEAKVEVGGEVQRGNGFSVPGVKLNLPSLTKNDISLARQSCAAGADWLAQSFVKKAADIAKLREAVAQEGCSVPIMAKIEKKEAVENLEEIIETADGVMVARGDLGIELSPEDVPIIQKRIIGLATLAGKPVVTATQMLESMINSPTPTRAEASDVANAIFDQTDAVMLSGETAIGNYPGESVSVMRRIIDKTEANINYGQMLEAKAHIVSEEPTDAISYASAELAHDLKASLIITATQTGNTAMHVSKYRPSKPILAVTPDNQTAYKLKMAWGVYPVVIKPSKNIDDMFEKAISAARENRLLKKGQKAVITAGVLVNIPGTTNLIKVQEA